MSDGVQPPLSHGLWLLMSFLFWGAGPALAGPPFATDDPIPVEEGHWEVYGFTTGAKVADDTSGALAGAEANFGAAPNLQLHAALSLAFDHARGRPAQFGIGDIELGAKYRFLTPSDDDWWPHVGIFPAVEIPTGDANRGLGGGHTREYFPVWLQKDFGAWSTYGGGGYWNNPGSGNRNFWFVGWLLQRQITAQFALGVEAFHRTADAVDGKDSTGFNLGAIYDISDHYHVLFSGGRGLQNANSTNQFSYYFGVQWTG